MARRHCLPGELTIYAVGANRSLFRGWLEKLPKGRKGAPFAGKPLRVDSASVNDVDAAGVQLLLALSRSLQTLDRPLQLDNPSRALVAACEGLGLTRLVANTGSPGARA